MVKRMNQKNKDKSKEFLEKIKEYIPADFEARAAEPVLDSLYPTIEIYSKDRSKSSKEIFDGDFWILVPESCSLEDVRRVWLNNIAYRNEAEKVAEKLGESFNSEAEVRETKEAINKRY